MRGISKSWAIAGVLAVAALAGSFGVVMGFERPASAPARRSELYPDSALVGYRYAGSRSRSGPDSSAAIDALTERVAGPSGSAIDMAELAELHYRRAQLTGARSDLDSAEALARRSLEILPAPNAAVLTLAKLANARHDFRGAIELSRQMLARSRSSAAHIVMASAHLALGDHAAALAAAERAVSMRPESSAYLMRALVHEARGMDRDAAADFARAAKREEYGDAAESARLRALWGRFLIRKGELAGAKALLAAALDIVPEYPFARGLQGELALRRGKLDDARSFFEHAASLEHAAGNQERAARYAQLASELDVDPALERKAGR